MALSREDEKFLRAVDPKNDKLKQLDLQRDRAAQQEQYARDQWYKEQQDRRAEEERKRREERERASYDDARRRSSLSDDSASSYRSYSGTSGSVSGSSNSSDSGSSAGSGSASYSRRSTSYQGPDRSGYRSEGNKTMMSSNDKQFKANELLLQAAAYKQAGDTERARQCYQEYERLTAEAEQEWKKGTALRKKEHYEAQYGTTGSSSKSGVWKVVLVLIAVFVLAKACGIL